MDEKDSDEIIKNIFFILINGISAFCIVIIVLIIFYNFIKDKINRSTTIENI